jgi:methionyl-tRNA formyltransferase
MSVKGKSLRVIFAGTPAFAVPCLQALLSSSHEVVAVYTQPDRKAGRGLRLQASPVKQLALQANVPVEQPVTLAEAQTQMRLEAYQADVMIVVAYGLILPSAVLSLPRLGCLNVHGSLLPRWRGATPMQQAILAGDAETGISFMLMDAGLDTGPVLRQQVVSLDPTWNTAQLHDVLAMLGAEHLLEVIQDWSDATIQAQAQRQDEVTYAPKIKKQDAEVDWSGSASVLQRLVNAYNPWPIAYSSINGQRIRIYTAKATENTTAEVAGTIVALHQDAIEVACGQNTLRLLAVQFAGGKVLPVAEILHAKRDLFTIGGQFTVIQDIRE